MIVDFVGQTLGQYRIEASLGAGGMGQVFRGMHQYLERAAAIKVMHAYLAADPTFRARFLQEAKAAATLKHPNIVEIYEFGEQEGYLYLVMELMTGGSVRSLLRASAGQPLPLVLGLDLMRQAAEGLAAAHTQGIVHRDIKPDNLLLNRVNGTGQAGEHYQLKISDFGLARLAEGSGLSTGMPMGTPAYMSPEQCQSLPLDGRSDLYSLGVVLYEVATGYVPFQINTLTDAFNKHVHVAPRPPREVYPNLSPALEAIILRCLAKQPHERYATATELASALQAVLNNTAATSASFALTGKTLIQPQVAGMTPPLSVSPVSRIGVAVTPRTLTITPGQPALVQVKLTNLGSTVDWFTPMVAGVAPDWVQGAGEAIQLNPGMQETVDLSVNVARTAINYAGNYPVIIRVLSREKPNEVGTMQVHWTVLPFKEDALKLEPRRASGRGGVTYTLTLHNGGNTQAQYELSGEDDEQQLTYRFKQNPVALEPGREVGVPLQVSTQRHWFGREQRQPFQVHARPADRSHPLTAPGEFVNKALLPVWLLAVVSVMLAAGLVLALLLPWIIKDKGDSQSTTPTPAPIVTQAPAPKLTAGNWITRTSNSQQILIDIVWSGSQYVVVGAGGTILTSPDGVTWNPQHSGMQSELRGIIWSEAQKQYVAVGAASADSTVTILTSPDGATWIQQTKITWKGRPSSPNLRGITWSEARRQYVAVGATGTILTSPDGVAWTQQVSPAKNMLEGIIWAGSQYVVVGGPVAGEEGTGTILTSPDGVTWTDQASNTAQYLRRIAWSGSHYVAVGNLGTILTSSDGITWLPQTPIPNKPNLGDVIWSGSQFIAVGDLGTVQTSPDGITWTSLTPKDQSGNNVSVYLRAIIWSGSQFVAVGHEGKIFTIS